MTDIRTRKTDHIALSLQPQHQALHGPGLDRLSFEPNPLPQMSLNDVEIQSQFLDLPVSAPFLIGAMTGGCENGELINQHLACDWGHMRLGSGLSSCLKGKRQDLTPFT